MADAVTTRTLFNGSRDVVIQITNLSDGTGESAVKKLDIATLIGPNGRAPTYLSLLHVQGDIDGMTVKLYTAWGTNPTTFAQLAGPSICINYEKLSGGGMFGSGSGTGDGSLLLTTTGHTTGDSYDLILRFRKKD